jgi:hypothetical protein
LCLKSVARQTRQPDEVIIADDGSRKETKDLIDSFRAIIKNLKHVWHEDNGYQRAKIINKSIEASDSDFIITTDQDCILHKNFILDYTLHMEEGFYISGYRIELRENITKKLIAKKRPNNLFDTIIGAKWNFKYQVRAPFLWKRKNLYNFDYADGTYGCNMGFYKKDVLAVNGYNEDFTGWGPEDSEMTQRLMNNGIGWKKVFYSAILYHMYHPIISRANLRSNVELVDKAISEKRTVIKNGIQKLN